MDPISCLTQHNKMEKKHMAYKRKILVVPSILSSKFVRHSSTKTKKDISTGIQHNFIETFQRFTKHLEILV